MKKAMKVVIRLMELPPIDNPTKIHNVSLRMPFTSEIRHTSVMAKPRSTTFIRSVQANDGGNMELVPVILFESDPDDEEVDDRTFVLIPPGVVIESSTVGNDLIYCGSFMYPQGAIFFLYEDRPRFSLRLKA